MRFESQRLDPVANGADLFFRRVGLHDNQHECPRRKAELESLLQAAKGGKGRIGRSVVITFPISRVVSMGRCNTRRTGLALRTKAKTLARVRSARTLPWLGFDRVQPNGTLDPGGIVESTHWMVLRRPSEPARITGHVPGLLLHFSDQRAIRLLPANKFCIRFATLRQSV